MAAEAAKRFLKAMADDPTINRKVHVALEKSTDQLAALAAVGRAEGYDFHDEELRATIEEMGRELSDDELSHVAGGVGTSPSTLILSGGTISPLFLRNQKDG